MSNRDIARLRLHNQRIAGSEFDWPVDVVSWLGAVQAQGYPGAIWDVGLRMSNAVEADNERALASKTIIRTWPMLGNWKHTLGKDAIVITSGPSRNSSAPKLMPSPRSQVAMVNSLTRQSFCRDNEGGLSHQAPHLPKPYNPIAFYT